MLSLHKIDAIKKNVHRGKILQDAVDKTGLTIEFITQKAGYKRVTYYTHINKENLSFSILEKYAHAIGYDFSDDIPDMNSFIVQEEDHVYKKKPASLKEALQQRDHWKDKYYELMEKYQKLLEKK